jgi:hypothetical protein
VVGADALAHVAESFVCLMDVVAISDRRSTGNATAENQSLCHEDKFIRAAKINASWLIMTPLP